MGRRKKPQKNARCVQCDAYGYDLATGKSCPRCLGTGLEGVYLAPSLRLPKSETKSVKK